MNEKHFIELLQQNQGIIYKLVNLYAQDDEEKKDLYQEIALQCWKSFATWRGDAKFSTWLYRIGLNTIFTMKRKKSAIVYTDTLPDTDTVNNATLQNENSALLYKCIKLLAETDRAIILLHLEGYENNEIAGLLGISANSLGVKLHRIKQRLTQLLQQFNLSNGSK
ncbi:MAG TPA: sigma-70 family RNA polymerase sigma factor [Ferruginibacter sp.]|nr:sigma-70 family RNA polymerase sigma factor [Ferruginibacter sp.]HMP21637.1 sigma-70 family RNA polymerase sigma factor [Ferruginibacter sp.]